MTHRSPRSTLVTALTVGGLLLCISTISFAQPAADRSALEEKKKLQAEKRAMVEKMKRARTRESSQQREERQMLELKAANQKLALEKAQSALQAAARRRNSKGLELMQAAWKLDPERMDYPFGTAAFAEGLKKTEAEFKALAAFMTLAKKELKQIGAADGGDYKQTILDRMGKADNRLQILRARITSGIVKISTPKLPDCLILLDGAWVGEGSGSIEAIAGHHMVKTQCLGHYTIEQSFNVRTGDVNSIVLNPKAIPYYGYLIINVKPSDGVTIFLDNVPVAKRKGQKADASGTIAGSGSRKDPYSLQARKWIIRFKKEGYDRWHRRITINRDQITIVNAALERLADHVEISGNE